MKRVIVTCRCCWINHRLLWLPGMKANSASLTNLTLRYTCIWRDRSSKPLIRTCNWDLLLWLSPVPCWWDDVRTDVKSSHCQLAFNEHKLHLLLKIYTVVINSVTQRAQQQVDVGWQLFLHDRRITNQRSQTLLGRYKVHNGYAVYVTHFIPNPQFTICH